MAKASTRKKYQWQKIDSTKAPSPSWVHLSTKLVYVRPVWLDRKRIYLSQDSAPASVAAPGVNQKADSQGTGGGGGLIAKRRQRISDTLHSIRSHWALVLQVDPIHLREVPVRLTLYSGIPGSPGIPVADAFNSDVQLGAPRQRCSDLQHL